MNESDLGKTGRHGGRTSPHLRSGQGMDTLAYDPPTSEAQRRAMWAAEEGHSTLGIPQSVGAQFVGPGDDAKGRWGGRAADRQPDGAEAEDIDPSKVWSLFNRPGTAGEKQAAKEALKRMGAWTEPTESRTEQKRPAQGPKRFSVTLQYTANGKTSYFGPHEVEAGDSIEAESAVRKMAKQHWAQTVGGRAPEFRASNTQRV